MQGAQENCSKNVSRNDRKKKKKKSNARLRGHDMVVLPWNAFLTPTLNLMNGGNQAVLCPCLAQATAST